MSEVTYYFNAYDTVTEKWETTPANMVDGTDASYAATTVDGAVQKLTANTCPGTDLGTITKVELRFYGYGDADDETIIRPVFAGGDGANHTIVPGVTAGWKAYQDITNDPNAPSWTFAAVVVLDCDVEVNDVAKGNTTRVGEVEIRVTYVTVPTVTTQDCDLIETTSARGNGNITDLGGVASCSRRGFCYMEGTGGDPTTANSVAYDDDGFGTGAYTKVITGLSQGTNYRVRAYAVNTAGTGYGTTVQLTTLAVGVPTNLTSPSQTENSIDLTWTKGENCDKTLIRFRDDQYPTGVEDGYQAYFDTGESVTVEHITNPITQEASNLGLPLYGASYIRASERINDFPVINISRVSFYLYKSGLPTGTAYIRIRKVSDDSILATIATKDVETLTTTPTWYDFDCNVDNPTQQDLRFTVEYDGGDADNTVGVRYQNADLLANAVSSFYISSWTDYGSYDLRIKIYNTLQPATTYYFRAWGYQTATTLYSTTTADLTQATSGGVTDYPISSAIDFGVALGATRLSYYLRSSPVPIGMALSSTRLGTFTRSSSVSFGIATTITRLAKYTRSSLITSGISVSATRLATFIRNSALSIGIAVSVLRGFIVSSLITFGISVSSSRSVNYIRTSLNTIGHSVTASRSVQWLRKAGYRITRYWDAL